MSDSNALKKPSLRQQASDPCISAWVSANAGAGKTRVLVDRIARLLLEDVQPQQILCLTYTRAAAAEMELRISERLGSWANLQCDELRAELFLLIGKEPSQKIINKAKRLFVEILESQGGLKIRTIHAFCESLLTKFPIEAQVAINNSVMDDRTANEILSEAKSALYLHAMKTKSDKVAKALQDIAGYVDESTFDDLMRELLKKRTQFKSTLNAYNGVIGLYAVIKEKLGLSSMDTVENILEKIVSNTEFNINELQEVSQTLRHGTKGDKDRAAFLSLWLKSNSAERKSQVKSKYIPMFLRKDGQRKKLQYLITKKALEKSKACASIVLKEQERVFNLAEKLKAISIAENTQTIVILANQLIKDYEHHKRLRAQIDYDDLIFKALELLRQDGGAGWVHFKLDGGIDHILVDEAQDTSPEQWEIIKHLTSDFFAGESNSNPSLHGQKRTMFAVGDEKQSIYSFQGADPEGFSKMRTYFQERANNAKVRFHSIELKQSFRSTDAVLDVVDAVFARPEAQAGVINYAGKIEHQGQRHESGGLVQLLPSLSKAERIATEPWDAPVDRIRETSPMAKTASNIASIIDKWLRSGEWLESKNRAMQAGDIMILVNKRGRFVDEMIRRLKELNIPVAGSDRIALTEQLVIMDLLAIAKFALLPEDDLMLATVLKGPFLDLSEDTLFNLAYSRDGTLWDAMRCHAEDNRYKAKSSYDFLVKIKKQATQTPPFEFFSSILALNKGRSSIIARFGNEANDPIDEFLNQALIFERTHSNSLEGFVAWISSSRTEIKRDMDTSHAQVRIMTVHGSKGLESNVVILPDTCAEPDGRQNDRVLWLSTNEANKSFIPFWCATREHETAFITELRQDASAHRLQEYRRLLYVAMTRARDRLYIGGWERRVRSNETGHGRDPNSWYELIHPAISEMKSVTAEKTSIGNQFTYRTLQKVCPNIDESLTETLPVNKTPPSWLLTPPSDNGRLQRRLFPSMTSTDDEEILSPLLDNDLSKFRRGKLIHRMLQTLPDLPSHSRLDAAINWLTRFEKHLTKTEALSIAEEALKVIDNPNFSHLFGTESMAEVAISGTIDTSQGQLSVIGQIDRLLIRQDSITIVDYKTNRIPPSAISHIAVSYLQQMATYKSILSQIYPNKSIECLIIWTVGPICMMLNEALINSHKP